MAAMENALAEYSRGNVVQPVRTILTVEESKRYFGVMPAVLGGFMGAKLVAFYPGNAGAGIPTHTATIALFDAQSGAPLAAMDGTVITEMRTAAVSAAVTRAVRKQGDAILALLGSGVQAEAHLEALSHVLRLSEVRVWSPTTANAKRFAEAHGARLMPDAESTVRGADVIVAVTSAVEPVLAGEWLKPGAHVNAVGANRPTWRELDDAAMHAGSLIVDSRAGAMAESGDVILSKAPIYAEAGELFAGMRPPAPPGTTIFKSLGMAVEDLAAAALVYAQSE